MTLGGHRKEGVNYYGYKKHVKTDSKSKIVTKYTLTDASAHDSQELDNLLALTSSDALFTSLSYSIKAQFWYVVTQRLRFYFFI